MIKRTILKGINKLGYDLVKKMHKTSSDTLSAHYDNICLSTRYSPWNIDAEFEKVFNLVKDYSLVDKYRMYELWDLVEQTNKLEGSIIEIGVWKGGTGGLIAQKAELSGKKSDRVYLADTFCGVVKATSKDKYYKGGEHNDAPVEIVKQLIHERLKLKNVTILQGIFPDDNIELLANERFRLCHIDVDVYQSAKDIVEWMWDKLVPMGVIVFDDYGFETCSGIMLYVNELKKQANCFMTYNLNGHALITKLY